MIISMQGNWTVKVKSKNASYKQRFLVSGATSGNGVHAGTVGNSISVTGKQWSIAVQNNPGSGFQLSDSQITAPKRIGNKYVFDIQTNDAGGDADFNDLILTCSTPATIFDYIVFGKVSLYSGTCFLNPCWRFPFVIDTHEALVKALKNREIKDLILELYPDRIREIEEIEDLIPLPGFPPLPDPPPFVPMVLDISGEGVKPTTRQHFRIQETKKTKKAAAEDTFLLDNVEFLKTETINRGSRSKILASKDLIKNLSDLTLWPCTKEAGKNLTLSFEEYDPTLSELNGGAYEGNGHREVLGDAITDSHGNYIFRFRRFRFFPPFIDTPIDLGHTLDIEPVISTNFLDVYQPFYFDTPDIIVKVVSGTDVLYETVPYYDIPNFKQINICIPKSKVQNPSICFNGNLIGSLGNVFIGGNQNVIASSANADLLRDGYNNVLSAQGKVSVHSSLAGFNIDCAAWRGTIDMKGCMYDLQKSPAKNKVKCYTIRIRRAGSSRWEFVSQNYKHPKFSKRNLKNYTGDIVGPNMKNLNIDGAGVESQPSYTNIQREVYADGVDWEFSNLDRYMQLNTLLHDKIAGNRTPGTFHVRVDGYDGAGNPVPGATDMIALFIHNLPLNFALTPMKLGSLTAGPCGLYRLADTEMSTPLSFSYMANDPYGFVDNYKLVMSRCPGRTFGLTDANGNTLTLPLPSIDEGISTSVYRNSAGIILNCPGYRGTLDEHSTAGMVNVSFTPEATGWINATEYFTKFGLNLTARMRVTNGYNTGKSSLYRAHRLILMEKLNP